MSVNPIAQELHDLRTLSQGHATFPQFGATSLDGGVNFYDPDGNQVGRLDASDGTLALTPAQSFEPPTPTPPVVTADAGIIVVEWSGTWEQGDAGEVTRPQWLESVEVHVGTEDGFAIDPATTLKGILPNEGGQYAVSVPDHGDYWVCLVAKSTAGRRGASSEYVAVHVAQAIIDQILADMQYKAVEVQETADGKNSVWRGPVQPEGTDHSVGDLWFDTDDGNMPYTWDGEKWVSAGDERIEALRSIQETLREDVDAILGGADVIAGNKNYYTPTQPDPAEAKENDLWFDTSNGYELYVLRNGAWVNASDARLDTLADAIANVDADITAAQQAAIAEAGRLADQAEADALSGAAADATAKMQQVLNQAKADATSKAEAAESAAIAAAATEAASLAEAAKNEAITESTSTIQSVVDSEVDAARTELNQAINQVKTTADGKNTVTYSGSGPSGTYAGIRPGDTWYQVTPAGLAGMWQRGATDWHRRDLTHHAIGSVDAGSITVGTLDAARIAANSVTADKLLVGNASNMLSNGNFANGKDGWISNAGSWPAAEVVSVTAGGATIRVLRVAATALSDFWNTALPQDMSARTAVTPGTKLRLRAKARRISGSTGALQVRFVAHNAGGQVISNLNVINGYNTTNNEWVEVEHLYEMPQDRDTLAVALRIGGTGDSVFEIASVSVTPMVGATLIEDGAILTNHLTANAVTAGKIAADAITADKIKAGAIGAVAIAADAVTADKLAANSVYAGAVQANAIGAQAIAAGVIEGEHIKGGSVTADKLLIGSGANLIPNGSFVQGLAGWIVRTSAPVDVTASGELRVRGGVSGDDVVDSSNFPVQPGTKYRLQFDMKGDVAGGITFLRVLWQTTAGTTINYNDAVSAYRATTEYSTQGAILEAPANAAQAFVRIYAWQGSSNQGTATQYQYFRNVSMRPSASATLIEDGAITTEKIATGAITAESGIITSLNAGRITVGEMDGARIKAGTIQANQVLIGGGSAMNADPWLRSLGTSAWQGESKPAYFDDVNPWPGSLPAAAPQDAKVLRSIFDGSSSPTLVLDEVTAKAGESYRITYWMRSGANRNTGMFFPFVQYWDGSSWVIWGTAQASPAYNYSAGDPWMKVETEVVSPNPLTQDRRIRLVWRHLGANAGSGQAIVTGISLERMVTNSMVVQGTITADKLQAGTITAESGVIGSLNIGKVTTGELDGLFIKAGSITTEKLAADSVTAAKLHATAINGMTITGATLQTAASGARAIFNSNGIHLFNSAGARTFFASTASGDVSMVGSVQTGLSGSQAILDPSLWQSISVVDGGDAENAEPPTGDSDTSVPATGGGGASTVSATGAGLRLGTGGNDAFDLIHAARTSGGATKGVISGPRATGRAVIDLNDTGDLVARSYTSTETALRSELRLHNDGNVRLASYKSATDMRSQLWMGESGALVLESDSGGRLAVSSNGHTNIESRNSSTGKVVTKITATADGTARMGAHSSTGAVLAAVNVFAEDGSVWMRSIRQASTLAPHAEVNVNNSGDARMVSLDTSDRDRAGFHAWRGTGYARMASFSAGNVAAQVRTAPDGRIDYTGTHWFGGGSMHYTGHPTTGSGANMYMANTDGRIARVTSALKYKTMVESCETGDEEKILDLQLKSWIDKAELERNDGNPEGLRRYHGLIADEVDAIGLGQYVTRLDGEVDGLEYDRLSTALIPVVRRLRDRLVAVESELAALKESNG